MDGYALRSAETRGANRDRPARFRLGESIFAGTRPSQPVAPGTAARIFTGAPIPEGADCVVRQEAAAAMADELRVFIEAEAGSNIRRRGEEMEEGQWVLEAGQPLSAFALGVLAAQGQSRVRARPSPRVIVLTTGDELVSAGGRVAQHQTYDSNSPLLAALCAEAGATVMGTERQADREDALRSALDRMLARADLVVTSGGASVGERDCVKRALTAMGAAWSINGVALKPGKPAGLAWLDEKPVAVLPGSPGAAVVAFDQLVRPILLALQGVVEERQRCTVRLDAAKHKQAGLTYLLSARLVRLDSEKMIARVRPQGAGQLLQNVGADGWVLLPQGRADFDAGEEVTMELFAGSSFHVFHGAGAQ
jgi:molybdopterin molybdotransferase